MSEPASWTLLGNAAVAVLASAPAGWPLVGNAVLAGVATALLRLSYRWGQDRAVFRRAFALEGDEGDVMTHLLLIDLVRANRHRTPRDTPRFLLTSEFDYPALFHKLLSYLPRRLLERVEWLVSPTFEGLHAAGVYVVAWGMLAGGLGTRRPASGALLVTAGFVLTPLFTANPRRGTVLGERCFGFLFAHAFLVCLVLFAATRDLRYLAPGLAAFTVAAASSKFGAQAMVFIGLAFALLTADPLVAMLVAGALLGAVVLTGGYVWRVLRGTVRHSIWYRRFLVHIHDYTSSFSSRDLAEGLRAPARGRVREAVRAFRRHPLHRLPMLVPWLVPFLGVELLGVSAPASGRVLTQSLAAWAWAALLVACLTLSDSLKFLGEGERYLEFGVLPMLILVTQLPEPVAAAVWTVALAWCVRWLVRVYRQDLPASSASEATRELVRWFHAQPVMTVMAVPGRLSFPLLYGNQHRAVWLLANAPREPQLARWTRLFAGGGIYPYPGPAAVAAARAEYGADCVVLDKAGAAAAGERWGICYDLSGLTVLFENDRYLVTAAPQAAAPAPPPQVRRHPA